MNLYSDFKLTNFFALFGAFKKYGIFYEIQVQLNIADKPERYFI